MRMIGKPIYPFEQRSDYQSCYHAAMDLRRVYVICNFTSRRGDQIWRSYKAQLMGGPMGDLPSVRLAEEAGLFAAIDRVRELQLMTWEIQSIWRRCVKAKEPYFNSSRMAVWMYYIIDLDHADLMTDQEWHDYQRLAWSDKKEGIKKAWRFCTRSGKGALRVLV